MPSFMRGNRKKFIIARTVAFNVCVLYNIDMNDLSLNEYLKSPCRACSIPYWKQKITVIPSGMKIVHDEDFIAERFLGYVDDRYFRLYHGLKSIDPSENDDVEIIAATPDKTDVLVDIINTSYRDLSVTKDRLTEFRKTQVYNPDLWILLKYKDSDVHVGSGIADYDGEAGELILEWIQILPQYRGRGFGRLIVNCLLATMRGTAKFATVSGKIDNPTNAETLYRKCGFVGNDVWHILRKK